MARRSYWRTPHDVYRIYDASGALLYVGASINAFARVPQHKAEHQPWWHDAHHFSVVRYADKPTARYFEALAIRDEFPAWNRQRETHALARIAQITPDPIEPTEWFYVAPLKGGESDHLV